MQPPLRPSQRLRPLHLAEQSTSCMNATLDRSKLSSRPAYAQRLPAQRLPAQTLPAQTHHSPPKRIAQGLPAQTHRPRAARPNASPKGCPPKRIIAALSLPSTTASSRPRITPASPLHATQAPRHATKAPSRAHPPGLVRGKLSREFCERDGPVAIFIHRLKLAPRRRHLGLLQLPLVWGLSLGFGV